MLVFLSDLHFSDGTTSVNVHETAFQNLFFPQISSAVKRKEKVKEIHLVLLGDIVDLVRTSWWFANVPDQKDRPWSSDNGLDKKTAMNPNTKKIESQYTDILKNIFAQTSFDTFVNGLKALENENGKKVTVSYIIGNHDRVLHNFKPLRDMITKKFYPIDIRFFNKCFLPEYGVIGRHGHEWDENCHSWEFSNKVLNKKKHIQRFQDGANKIMNLGEVITAELMSGIIYYVSNNLDLDKKGDKNLLANLKNVNNLRPMTDVFFWLEWFAKDRIKKYKDLLCESMRNALDSLLATNFAKLWDKIEVDFIVKGDLVDNLQWVNKILKKCDFDDFRSFVNSYTFLQKFTSFLKKNDEDLKSVQTEWETAEKDMSNIQYIVYGHTHESKHLCLSGNPEGKVKMYINTGTFLPLIQRTFDKKGFTTNNRMSFVFFYNKSEDPDNLNSPTVDYWETIKRKEYV